MAAWQAMVRDSAIGYIQCFPHKESSKLTSPIFSRLIHGIVSGKCKDPGPEDQVFCDKINDRG